MAAEIDIDFTTVENLSKVLENIAIGKGEKQMYSIVKKGFKNSISPALMDLNRALLKHVNEGNLLEGINAKNLKTGVVGGVLYGYAPHLHLFDKGTVERFTKDGVSRGKMPNNKTDYKTGIITGVIERNSKKVQDSAASKTLEAANEYLEKEFRKFGIK